MSQSTNTVIADVALHSDMALAAYANLPTGTIDPATLVKEGMSQAQADAFAENYTVVAQEYGGGWGQALIIG